MRTPKITKPALAAAPARVLTALAALAFSGAALAQDGDGGGSYIPDGYRIETVVLPTDAPFHVTGLDINEAGDVAVATRLGEVWILGAAAAVGEPSASDWRLFAEGLAEPTGLIWDEDGSIVVGQKPELTRLTDTDGDGVANDYTNLTDGWEFHDNYHEYNFGPARTADGAYVGTLNLGHGNPDGYSWGDNRVMVSAGGHRGWAYRVDPDGGLSMFASGLRSPAGVGVSPDGEIFYTDNQGDWVPTSKLHVLQEGRFYGHPASLRDHPDYSIEKIDSMTIEDFAEMSEEPVLWIPHQEVANSPGNPVWDLTGGGFGPFDGQIFICDQTQSNVFRAMLETVNGRRQGAVVNFANGFQSGNIRLAFHPNGDLWVGQTSGGWGSVGEKPFGLQRLVWDKETAPFELHRISMTENGFRLDFTDDLDPASISPEGVSIEAWRYAYSDAYGSDKIDLRRVEALSVESGDTPRSILIDVEARPGTVMAIDFGGLRSASGKRTSSSRAFYTVNTAM